RPPNSHVGPIQLAVRQQMIGAGDLAAIYKEPVDRVSAFESFNARTVGVDAEITPAPAPKKRGRAKASSTTQAAPPGPPPPPPADEGMITLGEVGRGLSRLAQQAASDFIRRNVIGTPRRRRR